MSFTTVLEDSMRKRKEMETLDLLSLKQPSGPRSSQIHVEESNTGSLRKS